MRTEGLTEVMNSILPDVKEIVRRKGNNLLSVSDKGHMNRTTGEWLVDSIVIRVRGEIYVD